MTDGGPGVCVDRKLYLNTQHLAGTDMNISPLERSPARHGKGERIVSGRHLQHPKDPVGVGNPA